MKVALVVQRFGRTIVGGSETLASHYASVLSRFAEVEILTTCARDHTSWRNHLPAGHASEDGVVVRRFPVDFERGLEFRRLDAILQGSVELRSFSQSPAVRQDHARCLERWPTSMQEAYARALGPYSTELLRYLGYHKNSYDAVFFFTYCYATTVEGLSLVDPSRTVLVPTLHDEPMAYLPIYRETLQRAGRMVFLSEAERRLAQRLTGQMGRSVVIGMSVSPPAHFTQPPAGTPKNYLLYAGRIEAAKGCDRLFEDFALLKQARPSDFKLVLVGRMVVAPPRHPDIVCLGFVGEAEKFALMKHARAIVNPSAFESFSIVVMESLSVGTPVLVNRNCAVTAEHVRLSGAGVAYGNADEWIAAVDEVLSLSTDRRRLWSERGRAYVAARYAPATIERKLCGVLHDLVGLRERLDGWPRAQDVPSSMDKVLTTT